MKVVTTSAIPSREVNADGFSTRKGSYPGRRLFTEENTDGLNFVFVRNEFVHSGEKAFETPRHRHTFAQIKYVEKGESNFAAGQFIREGEIAYFPRMAYYGPQFQENCISNVIQFGFNGEHQKGPIWEAYRTEALARLNERGRIEGGQYFDVDLNTGTERVRDGVQAVYEEQYRMHTGQPLVARPPRYESVILMHPGEFDWFEIAPGVAIKRLGAFFDQPGPNGDVRISMVRLDKGASFNLAADRPQLAWTPSAGLVTDGTGHKEFTSLYCPLGEEGSFAGDGVKVILVEFPRLG